VGSLEAAGHTRTQQLQSAVGVMRDWLRRTEAAAAAAAERERVFSLRPSSLLWPGGLAAVASAPPAADARCALDPRSPYSDEQSRESLRLGFRVGVRSRGRFATPADSSLHECSPYSHVHVRRESLGFVPRSRAISVPAQTLTLRFATFASRIP
jgi:hypothetical protein